MLKEFLKTICTARRRLNRFGQSQKIVDDIEIYRIENVINWDESKIKSWTIQNANLVKKVCPSQYKKQYYLILNNL
jgi:hypothetical protein